jgi:hypothetical protein
MLSQRSGYRRGDCGIGDERVVRLNVLSLQQPERVGFDDRFPEPRLGADRAVALAGALGQIEIAF